MSSTRILMIDGRESVTVEFHDTHCTAWIEHTEWHGRFGYSVGYDDANNDPLLAEQMARTKLIQRHS